jgi:hypothetical protein
MLINLYNRLRYRDEEGQALTTLGTNVTAVLSQIAAAIPGA